MIDYARQWENDCDAAYDPKTPPEDLDRLARGDKSLNRGRSWQRGVAQNENAWASTLRYLVGLYNLDGMVYNFIACNPNTPSSALIELAQTGYADVLERVIQHPNVTSEVFTVAADPRQTGPYLRGLVAKSAHTPIETLMVLAEDKSYDVRYGVSENPHTPPMVKLYLQSGQYGGMTLQEFLEASGATHHD